METIGSQRFVSYYDDAPAPKAASNTKVRKGEGHFVKTYFELANKIAELQFLNRDYVLLFRGQAHDHKNKQSNTSLKPTIFRSVDESNPAPEVLAQRFYKLDYAERELVERYQEKKFLGVQRLRRHNLIRWAILQHYEVCPTPLLDVTHSIRIAASFASGENNREGFIFVLGVPNLSGAITASSEAGLQIVRLSSACPPSAIRPHLQEGYLLGEYPEISTIEQKLQYEHFEVDFGLRLIAKFRFSPDSFWSSETFPKVSDKALYPAGHRDPLLDLALEVKQGISGI